MVPARARRAGGPCGASGGLGLEFARLLAPRGAKLAITGRRESRLNEIKDDTTKIITVEDPVEYQQPGISQIQTQSKIGLTFAAALRSILRHDPDVILIGEMRDLETSESAIQASLTGHMVFSTLHTNDAPSAFTRLIDMGIEPFLVSSTVEGVMAQRLVRTICKDCKVEYEPDQSDVPPDFPGAGGRLTLFKGAGCSHTKRDPRIIRCRDRTNLDLIAHEINPCFRKQTL